MYTKTWKIVYYCKPMTYGTKGVALVEGVDRAMAQAAFRQQYAGQFYTIDSCEPL